MLFLLLYLHLLHSALGQNRLMLKGRSHACTGRVDIYHSGTWKHVGSRAWTESNSEVVCKSLRCGGVVKYSTEYEDDRYPYQSVWASSLKCTGQEANLWDCDSENWNIPKEHVYVTCSEKPELSLILDGKKGCAGFVQLSTKQNYTLCADEIDKQKIAEKVCEELSCGKPTTSPTNLVFKDQRNTKKRYKCVGKEDFLWQCIDWSIHTGTCSEPVSVTCSNYSHFRLKGDKENFCSGDLEKFDGATWQSVNSKLYGNILSDWPPSVICAQVNCGKSGRVTRENDTSANVSLTCSDTVNMTLGEREGECHGTIYTQTNGSNKEPVCADSGHDKIGNIVCKEMGCGTFIKTYNKEAPLTHPNWRKLSCKDHAESLWHCQQKQVSWCNQKTAIMCSESFKVRLRDGLDECSGRVEVFYKGSWRTVLPDRWARAQSDIVCSHLGCGNATREEKNLFIDGDNSNEPPLKINHQCGTNDHLLTCLTDTESQYQKNLLKVVCQGHHVFFVNGDAPCSGTVGVEQAGETYALSGDQETWNEDAAQYVCRKMQCGNTISNSFVNQTGSKWMELRRQMFNKTSGHLYRLQPASPDTISVATVTCTGNVSVTLKNVRQGKGATEISSKDRCWGNVKVCRNGKCGGVCRDMWTNQHSEKLCANLGCGRPVKTDEPEQSMTFDVAFSSVYCPSSVSDLRGCSYVPNNGHSCDEGTAHVVCSGSLMAKLTDPRDKCAGTAEVYLAGHWLTLCSPLNKDIQNTVCKDVGCGIARDATVPTSSSTLKGLSTVTCDRDSTSLENCTAMQSVRPCTVARVTCSSWSRLVVFSGKSECDGPVFVKTESSNLFAVSSQQWRATELNMLCRNLGCSGPGNSMSKTIPMTKWWKNTYSCDNESQSIWECEKEEQQPVMQQLRISCQGQSDVSLTDGCYGQVLINNTQKVCSSGWTDYMSEMLCHNMQCNSQFSYENTSSASGTLRQFSCTRSESKLMECASSETTCSSGSVSVMCKGALDFNLTEHCGGQIRVFEHGEWRPACLKKNDKKTSNLLCERFPECGHVNTSKTHYGKPDVQRGAINTVISCDGTADLRQCVTKSQCADGDLRELYCDGFVDIFRPRELQVNLIIGVTVGVLLLVIIIALVLWQRRRIMKLLRGFSRTTSTSASDGLEDVEIRLKDEPGNQANGGEKVLESQSSEYDDVDEEPHRELMEVSSPGVGQAEEAPPLPARDVELDGERDVDDVDDDYTEGYDDVADPLHEQQEAEEQRALSQLEESRPIADEDADYVEPDDDV